MLSLGLPEKGIPPHEITPYFGKVLNSNINSDHYITAQDFEPSIDIENWQSFGFSNSWGFKCRFHDYEVYDVLPAHTVEFHCSQNDLDIGFRPKNKPNDHELIVHAPEIFDRELFDICSNDPEKVKKSKEILHRTIRKTLDLHKDFPNKKPKIVVHLGGMLLNTRHLDSTEEMMSNAINNFKEFEIYKDDVDIMPENLPSRPWYLGGEWYQHGFASAEDMLTFCNHYDLGMTYDVCHAQLYCANHNKNLVDYTKAVMPIVSHLHISDASGINGEGKQIYQGDIDFDELFNAMKGYKFSWVTEIWSGHLHKGAGSYKALQLLHKYKDIL